MFVRIVKLSFHLENIPAFLENFEKKKKKKIRWSRPEHKIEANELYKRKTVVKQEEL